MINAIEARKKALDNRSEETYSQLKEVEKEIENAVKKGEIYCYCYRWLSDQALKELYSKGYMVQNISNQRDGVMFKIMW